MKRALVTGANRGIGLIVAKGLIAAGLEVYLGARKTAEGQRVASEIGATPITLDVADPHSIEQTAQDLGTLDVLVNNAGILGSGGVLDSVTEYDAAMSTMVRGPFLLMHHFVPRMIAQGYGRVVNVTSGWGAFSEGIEGPGAYGVAKAALNALTVSSARGLPHNVKINAMCPGWCHTDMGGPSATRTPEQGADTAIWLATIGPEGPNGAFFRDRTAKEW